METVVLEALKFVLFTCSVFLFSLGMFSYKRSHVTQLISFAKTENLLCMTD